MGLPIPLNRSRPAPDAGHDIADILADLPPGAARPPRLAPRPALRIASEALADLPPRPAPRHPALQQGARAVAAAVVSWLARPAPASLAELYAALGWKASLALVGSGGTFGCVVAWWSAGFRLPAAQPGEQSPWGVAMGMGLALWAVQTLVASHLMTAIGRMPAGAQAAALLPLVVGTLALATIAAAAVLAAAAVALATAALAAAIVVALSACAAVGWVIGRLSGERS